MVKILSEETIRKILMAKYLLEAKTQEEYMSKAAVTLGIPRPAGDDNSEKLKIHILKVMVDSIAKKLTLNDRTQEIYDVEEITEALNAYVDSKVDSDQSLVEGSDPYAIEKTKESLRVTMKALLMANKSLETKEESYKNNWLLINTVYNLVDEEALPLDEPLSLELYDEVTRRMYSKKEYIEKKEKTLNLIADPDIVIKLITDPIIEEVSDTLQLHEIEQLRLQISQKIETELRPRLEATSKILWEVLAEEIRRIYSH